MSKLNNRKSNEAFPATLLLSSVLALNIFPSYSHASGSFSPSSGGGISNPYNFGKQIVFKKVACDTCPFPSKRLTKDNAMDLVKELESSEDIRKLLEPKERKAAIYYLKKRHKLS